jgi:hypothetical protein
LTTKPLETGLSLFLLFLRDREEVVGGGRFAELPADSLGEQRGGGPPEIRDLRG